MANLPVFAPQMLRSEVNGALIEAEMAIRPPFLYEKIATVIPSLSDRENYAWLAQPAGMEKFNGEPIQRTLTDTGLEIESGKSGLGYEVENETAQGILTFLRDNLADDKVGGYQMRIQDQVAVAQSYPDEQLITKLAAGESDTCYLRVGTTGEAFFKNDHAARGKQTATWSNLLTGAGTDVSHFVADIGRGLAAIYKMTNEAGRPMNRYCSGFFILHPVSIEVNMRTAVLASIISNTSNVGYRPTLELIPEPLLDLVDVNDWYIGTLDGGMRGLIYQDREGVQSEEVGEGSELWSHYRQMSFAVTRRGAPAYGYPQRLVKITNS